MFNQIIPDTSHYRCSDMDLLYKENQGEWQLLKDVVVRNCASPKFQAL